MEAKDTVINEDELIQCAIRCFKTFPASNFKLGKEIASTQAKISFKAGLDECAKTHFKPDWEINAKNLKSGMEEAKKAGIKEVIDWINEDSRLQPFTQVRMINETNWQAKLKEWGIE
jgi:hypothetical protein